MTFGDPPPGHHRAVRIRITTEHGDIAVTDSDQLNLMAALGGMGLPMDLFSGATLPPGGDPRPPAGYLRMWVEPCWLLDRYPEDDE